MEGEPVDRRGLLRDMFRQATNMIVPSIATGTSPPAARSPLKRGGLPTRSATREQLREAAFELGLGSRARAIDGLARRSLRLAVADGQESSGAVEFGGQALMREDSEWPVWHGRPLTLLAQVETGEPLGRLLFFYDAVGRPTGCLAAHRGSAAVLRASGAPVALRNGPAMPAAALAGALASELVIPGAFSELVATLELTQHERDAWQILREQLAALQGTELADGRGAGFTAVHRVFGYPENTNDEMPLTCELATAGEDIIEGRARLHPRAAALGVRARRWELLAQLSWDAELSWPWAAQRIYFWLDRDALAEGDLGEVWAIAR